MNKIIIIFTLLLFGCANGVGHYNDLDPPALPYKQGMSVGEFSQIYGKPVKLIPLGLILPDDSRKETIEQFYFHEGGKDTIYFFNYKQQFIGTRQVDLENPPILPYKFGMDIKEFSSIYKKQFALTPTNWTMPDDFKKGKDYFPSYYIEDKDDNTVYYFNYKECLIGSFKED